MAQEKDGQAKTPQAAQKDPLAEASEDKVERTA
jgi:hypothetical protein